MISNRTAITDDMKPQTPTNEDCLTLNIFVPVSDSEESKKYSVLFLIHGGGFSQGGSSQLLYNPSFFALRKKIIVVTFNYRLGLLGFGYLKNSSGNITSNLGLRDQQAALNWVKDNIEYFGGNSDDITIAGQSAGAASVTVHTMSKYTRGKFNKAIVQSGSIFCPWAKKEKEELHTLTSLVASKICGGSSDTYQCLKNAKVEDIISKTDELPVPYQFVPMVDNDVVQMKNKIHDKLIILSGVVRKESTVFMPAIFTGNNVSLSKPQLSQDFTFLVLENFKMNPKLIPILESYDNISDTYDQTERIMNMLWITCGVYEYNEKAKSQNLTVYSYIFDYLTKNDTRTPDYMKPIHSTDLYFLYGGMYTEEYKKYFNYQDRMLASLMRQFWKNFIENGNPSARWNPYNDNFGTMMIVKKAYMRYVKGIDRCPSLLAASSLKRKIWYFPLFANGLDTAFKMLGKYIVKTTNINHYAISGG